MRTQLFLNVAWIIMLGTIVACNTGSNKSQENNHDGEEHTQEAHSNEDCTHVHWAYTGEEAPDKWKDLCSKFSACGGTVQSPINIEDAAAVNVDTLPALKMEYGTSLVDIINNGHTVQFNISGENYLTIGEKKYKLLQFHFHALSEHTVNGQHAPIEVHFVHKNTDTDYAVVGALFTEGAQFNLFSKYLADFPAEVGEVTKEEEIELAELLPADLSYYYYSGSLTTPPCSEVVNWYVLKSKDVASKEQIEKMAGLLHENYRPVMPLNERTVLAHAE